MIRRRWTSWITATLLFALLIAGQGWSTQDQTPNSAAQMREAAQKFVATLDAKQVEQGVLPFDTEQRFQWHFIPKDERKGLQVKHLSAPQRQAAFQLMKAALGSVGYEKSRKIMELENVLREMEKDRTGGAIRDPERYYFTLFGKPDGTARWGLSIEGHHLSLNFTLEGDQVVSSTPTFLATNPATVKTGIYEPVKVGTRVLAAEEKLAFELLESLDETQRKKAIIAAQAPREIRAAGETQPPQTAPVGISHRDLNEAQRGVLRNLVISYCQNVPDDVRRARIRAILEADPANVHFAWAGATEPGVGHYYRVQGPTFLIEFVNTQPDPAGNPANHIHCVWRDMKGDFGIPLPK